VEFGFGARGARSLLGVGCRGMSARGFGGVSGAPPVGSGAEPQEYLLGGLGNVMSSPSAARAFFDSFHAKSR